MKICFRCKKEIEKNSHHYAFTEINEGKEIRTDYAHKKCWDEFLKQIGNVDEAMSMLRGIKRPLQKMGILQPEEVIIK
ncbi:MAG: hypothetical protein ACTSYG_10825 [Candidatus Heimdallarchaeota archaeon]